MIKAPRYKVGDTLELRDSKARANPGQGGCSEFTISKIKETEFSEDGYVYEGYYYATVNIGFWRKKKEI